MDYKTALGILRKHNLWRRDDHVPNQYEMVNPKDLGKAIDTAVEVLENLVMFNINSFEDLYDQCISSNYYRYHS